MALNVKIRWIIQVIGALILIVNNIDAACVTPAHFHGDWYSIERGKDLNYLINEEGLSNEEFDGACEEYVEIENTADADGRYDAHVLFYDGGSGCYVCWQMYHRTPNVLQVKISTCRTSTSTPTLEEICADILPQSELLTIFRKTMQTVNCKNTFEGVFHFTYEVLRDGGSVCDSPRSTVIACQEPGSPYVDNQVFNMEFGKCPAVSTSVNEKIRFQCMGSWRDKDGNIFAAVANLGKEIWRERFRCLLTRNDQQLNDNTRRWTMSRWAQCNTLKSPYEGPYRLVLLPVVYGSQLVPATCNFPRNFTGTWFTTGEFDTEVKINSSHIYFKTKLDQFTYKETYFTCQQNRDGRYLVTAVTVGKCEVDYICFDFVPRHHNIVRWRMGKPYRMLPNDVYLPGYLKKIFRQACTWSSFTIDRNDIAWKYHTFLLDPPAPVDCPIAGRYHFKQTGAIEEQYQTRIYGITERPRHQIDCREYVTEFKSCQDNTKKIFIDAEYCATVDHTGRPIGEYDEPDRELNCVGFWMEDMRSYLITYDEEDAVSRFRCWVYERLDWRDLIISRANRASCGTTQTARSYRSIEGAGLALELKEAERLFDDCPQRFNAGRDPYEKSPIYVLGGSAGISASVVTVLFVSIVTLFNNISPRL